MVSRTIATALALLLAFYQGAFYAQRQGYCVYCHAPCGPPPADLDHWRTCPIHPARAEVAKLQALVDQLRPVTR